MKKDKIYIEELGYFDPIQESDTIIWYWNQKEKLLKAGSKSVRTRYWLNMKEIHKPTLLRLQAYELLSYLNEKATSEQEKRRTHYRKKAQEKAHHEMEEFKKWHDQKLVLWKLTRNISLN